MSKNDPAFRDHLAWLGYLQPDGLVVSPAALVDSQIILDRSEGSSLQQKLEKFLEEVEDAEGDPSVRIENVPEFFQGFLEWPADCLFGKGCDYELPADMTIALPELGQSLTATYAFRNPKAVDGELPWMILIKETESGADFDQRHAEDSRSWNASEHQKLERLMRETQVSIGLLTNREQIRLIYAPRGESTGHITFPIEPMQEVQGRLIIGAFYQLLKSYTLITAPSEARLSSLLKKSRDYQANVSTKLAEQVVEALYELLRGFQSANEQTHGALLDSVLRKDPDNIYKGLLNTLLRLVFLLYAEDRGLMPTSGLYIRNYAVHGLFERLRADAERYPDTMDHRFGAWSQLLALFRLVHSGSKNPMLQMPPRSGYLFDPKPCPFLEGKTMDTPQVPLVPDGTIFRVLSNLLLLDGERLSYKTLDVEQIGSVYETIMGFRIEQASGRMIAIKPKKRHGAPLHIDLDELVVLKPAERVKVLIEQADTKLPAKAEKELKDAKAIDELLVALEKRIDPRATPSLVAKGAIILQPTDERRRSGSHYTPRSFTEPIVRKTLEPILERMGRHPKPEAILDLKVADIAVGSAAFLVEACRQLADELVASWHYHQCVPPIPPDEDEVLFSRRKIAQRCLYGVDRNPMAVDLAKLSLWLATMAKDHPFTFLDHSIKCGDSLVGLTNKQIAAFHWDTSKPSQMIMGEKEMKKAIEGISKYRKEILDWPDDNEWAIVKKQEFLKVADEEADRIRTVGDLAIAAFFNGLKPKERQELREIYLAKHLELQRGENLAELIPWEIQVLSELRSGEIPVRPFHWELEFPEVFSRENSGFDAIVGNPPFAGKNTTIAGNPIGYLDWLKIVNEDSHGNADLVCHFFRKAFDSLSTDGALGLIATNTIAQGDTRSSGLKWICMNGGEIYDARRRVPWPGEASVIVSIICILKGKYTKLKTLDSRSVGSITAFLFHSGGHDDPRILASNNEKSFVGSYLLGGGFVFDDEDTKGTANRIEDISHLIKNNSKSHTVILPYIGGNEVNNHPSHKNHRFAINLHDYSEEKCWQNWPEIMRLLEEKVKPIRETDNRESYRRLWWQYAEKRPKLYRTIQPLSQVLVCPGGTSATKHLAFAMLPRNQVFSQTLCVFSFDSLSCFSILQSRVHDCFSRFFGATLGDGLRYNSSSCFEPFPFPKDWQNNQHLEAVGKEYYKFRADLMVRNDEGLTKTYNRFHDPEETSPAILKLRELHAQMDRAVLDAYGWTDVPTDCEFLLDYEDDDEDEDSSNGRRKKKPWRYRWPDDVRDDVLARLLALNQELYEEEVRQGLHAKKGAKRTVGRKTSKKTAGKPSTSTQTKLLPDPQGDLFE